MAKFPKAKMDLIGEDANVFSIMGRATRALRRAGATQAEQDEYQTACQSGDYNNALTTTMDWVNCDGADDEKEEDDEE